MSTPAPEMGQTGTRAPRGYSEEIITRAEVYVAQGMRRRDARRLAQRELAGLEVGGPNPYRNIRQDDLPDPTGITASWRADR